MKIKKGDKVKILAGKDRGKTGTIDRVFVKTSRVLIGGLNLYKKHLKPRSDQDKKSGGIVSISRPLDFSKVAVICPKCNKAVRIGFNLEGKEKIRICKTCKSKI